MSLQSGVCSDVSNGSCDPYLQNYIPLGGISRIRIADKGNVIEFDLIRSNDSLADRCAEKWHIIGFMPQICTLGLMYSILIVQIQRLCMYDANSIFFVLFQYIHV